MTDSDRSVINLLAADVIALEHANHALAEQLITFKELLSEALTTVHTLTIRCERQTEQIKRLLGQPMKQREPIVPAPVPDIELPPNMVRAYEINWGSYGR